MPPVIFLIPNYLIVQNLGWLDTIWAITIPGAASAFGIFFLRQFFVGLPAEIEEAARIDGAGDFRIFLQIVLPLARPALATLAVLELPDELERLPVAGLRAAVSPENMTLQPGLSQLQGAYSTHFAIVMAGAVIASVPVLILFVFAQRQIVDSVATSGRQGMRFRAGGSPRSALRSALAAGLVGCSAASSPGATRRHAVDRAASRSTATSPTRTRSSSATPATRYATEHPGVNVQVATSERPEDLEGQRPGCPARAAVLGATRARPGRPDVGRAAPTAASRCTSRRRTPPAAASASASPSRDSRTGPFALAADKPLVCPVDEGGAIDAERHRRRRPRYLVWKNDGNCCGSTPGSQLPSRSSADGASLAGEPTRLLKQTESWEGKLVEAPSS